MDATPSRTEQGVLFLKSHAVTGLFVLGLFYTAYFARAILIPITMALLLNFVLAPLSRSLSRRLRVPHALSATIVVVGFFAALVFGISALSTPASEWMAKFPEMTAELERKLRPIGATVKEVQETARKAEDLAQGGPPADGDKPVPVVVRGPSLASLFIGQTMTISIGFVVMAALLLFLVASGDSLLRQAVSALPRLEEKKKLVEIMRTTEDEISHYLASISLINLVVGIVVGATMWWLDMPNPALWGVMAGLFNYVPFIGGLISFAVIALVALVSFESFWMIALPPAAYLAIHILEGQILTPLIVSRRLLLNPIAIVLSLIFWT